MTASKRRVVTSIVVFLLPALLGLVACLGLARQAFVAQQERWATHWLAPQIERSVPFSWIHADETANFARLIAVFDDAMAYWAPFSALDGVRLVSLKNGSAQTTSVGNDQYTLNYADGSAVLSLAPAPFLDTPQVQVRLAIAVALSLLVAGLSIWLWPTPYSTAQARAFREGLTTDVWHYPHLRRLVAGDAYLPLLQSLLNSEGASLRALDEAFERDYAGDLAGQLAQAGWSVPDICILLHACKDTGEAPPIEGADYAWWKLLTKQHDISPLTALRHSREPQIIALEPETRKISLRGLSGTLPPRSFALLMHIAQRALAGEEPLRRPTKAGDPQLAKDLLAIYEDLPSSRAGRVFESAITGEDFNQMIAHLNSSIKDIVGDDALAKRYQVHAEGHTRAEKAYQISCSFVIL